MESSFFTDESRFNLKFVEGRLCVWRRDGERIDPANVIQHDRFGGSSVMVWGGISHRGKTDLVTVHRNLNAMRYCNETVQPALLPFLCQGHAIIFQLDNAWCHVARHRMHFLQANNVNVLDWPARSPDISPIKHLLDHLGRRVRERNDVNNIGDLERVLHEEWIHIPMAVIRRLISSMRRRFGIESFIDFSDTLSYYFQCLADIEAFIDFSDTSSYHFQCLADIEAFIDFSDTLSYYFQCLADIEAFIDFSDTLSYYFQCLADIEAFIDFTDTLSYYFQCLADIEAFIDFNDTLSYYFQCLADIEAFINFNVTLSYYFQCLADIEAFIDFSDTLSCYFQCLADIEAFIDFSEDQDIEEEVINTGIQTLQNLSWKLPCLKKTPHLYLFI